MIIAPEIASAKPYLLRAMYEWCTTQGFTPFVSVFVDEGVQVPMAFVKDETITLNAGTDATHDLLISDEFLQFKARFGGVPQQVMVPISNVMAIYARENGQGMAFPISEETIATSDALPKTNLPMPSKLSASPILKKDKTKPAITRIK
jgi:stringent starvation protein B